jgi:para-nitrobenzyl esterase
VRDATAFASPCIQLDFVNGGTLGSEDCLYLNVFAPSDATATSNLAVMVHLHPGSNSGFHPYQDAAAFTSRGVIVVTVGYRLGVFGFVGHPALSAEQGGSSGEYGLLDQLAALRWVHNNIAAFGGDPSRVTLFGSSAGSFDTVALMASPLSQGLISGAAVQGDVQWGLTGNGNHISDAEQLGLQLSQSVGCAGAADVLACLRAKPASDLVEAAGPLDIVPWVGGKVLPESPLQLVRERRTVPLLVGFNREEEAVFQPNPIDAPYPSDKWVKDTNALVGPVFGTQARALYPASAYDSLLWSYITMQTDAVRGCPIRQLANSVQAPVYRYLYTHVYENDPFFAQFRASHILEDPLLWGGDIFGFGHTFTPAEQLLSQRMTDYWTNFAKTGDPNGTGLPTWPQYNAGTEPTLTLDDQIGVITNYHDAQCGLLDKIEALYPPPWLQGAPHLPAGVPPGFLYGHARAFPG